MDLHQGDLCAAHRSPILRLETAHPGAFAIGDAARWPDLRAGGLVRIEHWMLAQRQGQAVARTIVGERVPFTGVPFFWSQHYGISINYVRHAERWEAIEVDGNLEQHDVMVRSRNAGRVVAVASLSRDRESLEANWPWNTTRLRCDKTPGVPGAGAATRQA